ncbi:hypothetical protein ACGFNU_01840 [Spirillospora sp. NPDC048911]|uniref:hypothetical protein n=1 Tax=Spirillospora sp. NPDC048911 TaxID=3364527 RepID=UPI0037150D6B
MTVRVLGLTSGTTAEDHRLGLALLSQPMGGTLRRASGVLYQPGSCDLVAVAARQAEITPFTALVGGTSHALQSAYPVVSDARVPLTFDPGEPSVERVDQVIVRVRDGAYDGSGAQYGSVDYLKGQASGAPAPLPATSLPLWEVKVPPGSAAIDFTKAVRKHSYTAALGAPVPVDAAAARDRLPAHDTLTVLRLDNGDIEQRRQGAWRSADWRADTGWTTIPAVLTGWQIQTTPRVRRVGSLAELRGTVLRKQTGTANPAIVNLPAAFRPSSYTPWLAALPRVLDRSVLMKTDSGGAVAVELNLADLALDTVLDLTARWTVG